LPEAKASVSFGFVFLSLKASEKSNKNPKALALDFSSP
jgi:hypothetical protein